MAELREEQLRRRHADEETDLELSSLDAVCERTEAQFKTHTAQLDAALKALIARASKVSTVARE